MDPADLRKLHEERQRRRTVVTRTSDQKHEDNGHVKNSTARRASAPARVVHQTLLTTTTTTHEQQLQQQLLQDEAYALSLMQEEEQEADRVRHLARIWTEEDEQLRREREDLATRFGGDDEEEEESESESDSVMEESLMEYMRTTPTVPFSSKDARMSRFGHRCEVCLIPYEEHVPLRILPCTHYFHATCVERWFDTSSQATRATCPSCKVNVLEPGTGRQLLRELWGC